MIDKKQNVTMKDCEINAVKFDGQALSAINTVAQALLNLTRLFTVQGIEIDALVKMSGDGVVAEGCTTKGNSNLDA